MAIIKCKMCGGGLELVPDATVCECEYCGTRQTVPAADSEKKLKLFERANRLRRACEFDKAAGVYESIVADFDTESEAYWGLVLCKFGIEYVDDPATGKKVPTCHRSSFESIFEDDNFEQACENADGLARRVYREEAKAIEELRRGIIEVSSKEEPYDIFISYKELTDDGDRTLDSVIAQDIYTALTEKGYRVFFSRISLEDKLGTEYEPYIFAALQSAKVMLAVGTDYDHFNAVWVKNEWSRFLALIASGQKKTLIPVFKDIDAYDMPKEFNKLAAQDMGKVGAMQDLLRGVEKIIPLKTAEPVAAPQPAVMSGGPNVTALQKRGVMALEDAQWDAAKDFFNQILNMEAENAEAWLGLAMADLELQHERAFSALPNGQAQADGNASFRRFLRFAAPERVREIQNLVSAAEATKQKRAAAEAERRAAEEERHLREAAEREARKREREARLIELKAARERIAPAQGMIAVGENHTVGLKSDGSVVTAGVKDPKRSKLFDASSWRNVMAIVAGQNHTVGLKEDGTVFAAGGSKSPNFELTNFIYDGRCEVSGWKNVIAIDASYYHTVGLKGDGTVVAIGNNEHGACNVSDWKGVMAIAAGPHRTVGLKENGTVVAVGKKEKGRCDVSGWRDIIAISAADFHTVGLKSNGTVVAVGHNVYGQCNVSGWRDIIEIAANTCHTVGLKVDGTVIATGKNDDNRCDVTGWKDIIAIVAGRNHTVGLKMDGSVVAAGTNSHGQCNVSEWKGIIAIGAGAFHTVGLKADGTVVAVGSNMLGQCDVFDWKLFDSIETLEQERATIKKQRIADLKKEQKTLFEELPTIKGIFAGTKRAKLEARLAEIAAELKMLGAE